MKKHRITIGVLLVLGWMGVGTGGATTATTATTTNGCSSSCPSTCAAQNHFGNLAQESLALAQPPSPQTSFAQGCLGTLDSFNLSSYFNPSLIGTLLQQLEQQIISQACSTLTNTMNNEVSQGNGILNFALNPAQLEQGALNSASGSVLNAEQGALSTATNPITNTTGSYASDAGSVQNTISNASGNALSGNWVNNLY
jgi:hypothetical protein